MQSTKVTERGSLLQDHVTKLREEGLQHFARTVTIDKSYVTFAIERHVGLIAFMKQETEVRNFKLIER